MMGGKFFKIISDQNLPLIPSIENLSKRFPEIKFDSCSFGDSLEKIFDGVTIVDNAEKNVLLLIDLNDENITRKEIFNEIKANKDWNEVPVIVIVNEINRTTADFCFSRN